METKPKNGLKLLPATVWNLNAIIQLHHDVFCEVDPMKTHLYPAGITQAILDESYDRWRPSFNHPEKEIWMKMTTPLGRLVAYARWFIDGQEELDYQAPNSLSSDAEVSSEVRAAWKLDQDSKRANIKEEKFLFLAPLVTAKDQRGKGCGKTLLQWGSQYARDNGLPLYLMSLPAAKGFYLKHGFEVVGSPPGIPGAVNGTEAEARFMGNTLMRMK